jgi:hypothetical protein
MQGEPELIAPCGMNCAVCSGYLAYKNDVKKRGVMMPYCEGCRPRDKKCAFLKKRCELLRDNKVKFCYECKDFPCEKLGHIDKRYQTFFRMSLIGNLEFIKKNGMSRYLETQEDKWRCPTCGGAICCHNGLCFNCDFDELRERALSRKKLYRWEQ